MNILVQSYDENGIQLLGMHSAIVRNYNSLRTFLRYWLFNKEGVWLKNEFRSSSPVQEIKVFTFTNIYEEKTYRELYSLKKGDYQA